MPINNDLSKHGWKFVAGFVAAVLISITTLFFYTGSIMSGLIMTGILVLLLVSASRKDRHDHQTNANLEYNGQNSQDAARTAQLAADQPPLYRLTWRRSFIEKFKTLTNQETQNSEESLSNLEAVTTISGNIVPHSGVKQQETTQSIIDPMSPPAENLSESLENDSDDGLPSFEEATEVRRSYLMELLTRDLITSGQIFLV